MSNPFSNSEIKLIRDIKTKFLDNFRNSSMSLAPLEPYMVYAGGMWASFINNENPRDIDLFVLSGASNSEEVFKKYFKINSWELKSEKTKENSKYNVDHITKTMIYSNPNILGRPPVNLIFTSTDTAEELIEKFDYLHTQIFFNRGVLNISKAAFDAAKAKKLIPLEGRVISEMRQKKFLENGWKT